MTADPPKLCVTTCAVCGNDFEYKAKTRGKLKIHIRLRKVCDDCRAAKLAEAKRRFRASTKRAAHEDNFPNTKPILKKSHAEIAKALHWRGRKALERVSATERQGLLKIRKNPELKELFDRWLEDEAPTVPTTDAGQRLLDYQLAVIDWWAVHDKWAATPETMPEAEATLKEIVQFQHQIVETLGKL